MQIPAEPVIKENIFGTSFPKNALLSYLLDFSVGSEEKRHSNCQECLTIAEIVSELGYNVDVINWDNSSFKPFKGYHLLIDNHNNLERLQPVLQNDAFKIFHATNAHWLFQNSVVYSRHSEFLKKTGVSITPSRLLSRGDSAAFCDAISMFGNEFTKATYGRHGNKVWHLPMSVTAKPELIKRDIKKAKKQFIWLNSHGALLKGLDVVIDAFANLPDFTLYICGDLDKDREFFNTIANTLAAAPNIVLKGWIDIDNTEFIELVSSAAWIINTSFSEGGGGSTLNCMAKGLIPIISRSASISLPAGTGFYLEQNEPGALVELIHKVSERSEGELEKMAQNAYQFIAANHTLENFRRKYKEFLMVVTEPVTHSNA